MVYRLRPDVARAAGALTTRLALRGTLRAVGEHVPEPVEQLLPARRPAGGGVLVRTASRLLFVRAGSVEAWALTGLTAARWTPGPLSGRLDLVADGREVELGGVPPRDGVLLVDALRPILPAGGVPPELPGLLRGVPGLERLGEPRPPARQLAPEGQPRRSRADDVAAQLRALLTERDAGRLTYADFEAARARVLRGR